MILIHFGIKVKLLEWLSIQDTTLDEILWHDGLGDFWGVKTVSRAIKRLEDSSVRIAQGDVSFVVVLVLSNATRMCHCTELR